MISLAARDVHPPLYYLMVKAAVELVHLFAPGADAVIICKVVSVLPYLALLGYSPVSYTHLPGIAMSLGRKIMSGKPSIIFKSHLHGLKR